VLVAVISGQHELRRIDAMDTRRLTVICTAATIHGNHTHTHTHPFNGLLSGTTQVSQYQKGKTNVDFTGARDSERHWYQLGHMQVCTLLQTDNHASTSLLKFFTGRMPFLLPNNSVKALKAKYMAISDM